MKRTLTIKGRTGLFDIPSFIISENQNLKIAIKFATPMRAERYKLVVKHGDLLKTYGVVYDNAITIPAEWIKQNNENLEFSLVFLDEKGIRVTDGPGARNGFRAVAAKAGAVLQEPIMSVEVVTPEENMGDIIGDLNKRRGQIAGMEQKGNARVVKAQVPLSEMFGYVTVLRTLSSGRATSSMEFNKYDVVPNNVAQEVIEKAAGKRKNIE